jgi:hypothetical protein
MPSIKDQSTVQAIAREYCSNGRCKVKALITIGYKERYANTVGLKSVYDNIRVKEAIRVIDGAGAVKSETTVESVQKMYQAAYDLAKTTKQSSSMVSAATGIARLYGMDKDTQTTVEQPLDLTPEEHAEALAASNRINDIKAVKSKTA